MASRSEIFDGISEVLEWLLDLILWLLGVILKAAVWTVMLMLLLTVWVALGVGLYFLLCRYISSELAVFGGVVGWFCIPAALKALTESWEEHGASKQ